MTVHKIATELAEWDEQGVARALVTLLGEAQTELGVSNRQLEKRSGVHNQNIGRIRNLKVDPTCGSLSKLFAALGVAVEVTVYIPDRLPVLDTDPPTE